MTTEQFAYWLQGFFEIQGAKEVTPTQVQIIKDHLALVFNKVTPHYTNSPTYCAPSVGSNSNPSRLCGTAIPNGEDQQYRVRSDDETFGDQVKPIKRGMFKFNNIPSNIKPGC